MSQQLREECVSMLPAPYELGILVNLYRAKVDPIFPILQDEELDSHATMDALVLKQCVCLVAALDPKVRKRLRLPHTERILSPIEFRACVASAVKQALDMGFIDDNMVLLQVCALMAFYADQANCSEVSAHYVSQAVHHAQTLGLHLGWPDDGAKTEKSRRIFWCIWILDRLNAAANGRPILIHRQDMDAQVIDTFAEQSPAFKLHIRIAQFLDRVISRYRPQSVSMEPQSLDEDITFEDLVLEAGAVDVGSSILGESAPFAAKSLRLFHDGNSPLFCLHCKSVTGNVLPCSCHTPTSSKADRERGTASFKLGSSTLRGNQHRCHRLRRLQGIDYVLACCSVCRFLGNIGSLQEPAE